MVLGRFIGIFVAVSLAVLFPTNDPFFRVLLILIWSAIGLILSLLASVFIGPLIPLTRPLPQDGEKYWTSMYGEEMGKIAYQLWTKSIDDKKE